MSVSAVLLAIFPNLTEVSWYEFLSIPEEMQKELEQRGLKWQEVNKLISLNRSHTKSR